MPSDAVFNYLIIAYFFFNETAAPFRARWTDGN